MEDKLLQKIGVKNFEDLLSSIPKEHLFPKLKLGRPKTEMELAAHIENLAGLNQNVVSFLGAGAYDHHIPAAVWELARRGEFLTAYTPYQAEAGQGTLLALFEFQTMIAELFGLDAANASLYDGATALAEAVMLARRHFLDDLGLIPKKALIPQALHPHFKSTLATYMKNLNIKIIEIPFNRRTGATDFGFLKNALTDPGVFAFAASQPNFFGVLEDMDALGDLRRQTKALFISVVNNPISLGILNPPGRYNADIAVADGQPLGIPLFYGGPHLGLFAIKKDFLRKMPGRICGRTIDAQGRPGYTLTLQTREQHIRREKATSNICTNQTLCAVAATIYLSLLGPDGLKEAAELTFSKAHELWEKLKSCGKPLFDHEEFFQEFAFKPERDLKELEAAAEQEKIVPGCALGKNFPELAGAILVAATEKTSGEAMDRLVKFLTQGKQFPHSSLRATPKAGRGNPIKQKTFFNEIASSAEPPRNDKGVRSK
ncbi:MAG: aminomethyl-transferring glycine dehydrogenase subunit GcvPA [Elusimicrobia bacterium]|nr:aminomethyl-transferring glycine dehydrogenase subunit GcvPA [Elusimicrobiota bacterium]